MPIPTLSATAFTESLIDNLAQVPQLKVKSRNSVLHYKGKDIDLQKVGNDLGRVRASGRAGGAPGGQH